MRTSIRKKRLSLAALALAFSAGMADATIKSWESESDSIITFAHASDWRCFDHDGCSTCRNFSFGDSEIIVDHGGGRAKEHYFIPPGYTLEVCHPAGLPL